MTPKIDKAKLKKELKELYRNFLLGEDIVSEAKTYFQNYSGAQTLLDKAMNDAVGYLENIGWNLEPKEDIAKEILEELEKDE